MAELFSTFFHTGIFGSVIILVILLMRPLLRKAPRQIICILWILAAVRLLVPFQLESRLSLQPKYPPQLDTIATVEKATTPKESSPNVQPIPTLSVDSDQETLITPNVSLAPQPVEPDVRPAPEPIPDSTTSESVPQQVAATSSSSFRDYRQIISAVWLGVALSLFQYAVAAYCILKFKLREAVKCSDGALEISSISGAFLLGYFKPEIYLPKRLKEQDREYILSHEQAHIKRGDNWWKLLGLLCVCIHWYNPLVWVSYTLLCRDIEIACDEQVIQSMQLDDRKAYSLALLNSGKRMSGLFVYPVAFGEISLKQRIKNVLSYRKPGLWITTIAIVLVAVIAICFMTSPKTDSPKESGKGTTSTSSQMESSTSSEPEPLNPEPTEPKPTVPESPETSPAEPKPTVPESPEDSSTEPQSSKPVVTIVAEGQWNGESTQWKIFSDGVLAISGSGGISEASQYIWKDYANDITKIVIEDGIVAIPRNAFSNMTGVTSVRLGKDVKTVYPQAFSGCISLSSLIFSSSCQLENIGEYAFAGTGLTSFSSPSSLRCIDAYAFNGCNQLQNLILQGGIAEIKENAFKDCVGLKHVTLGDTICFMDVAFNGCSALESVHIYTPNGWGVPHCESLQSVAIGGNVTSIHELWFSCCNSLSEVVITAPVEEICSNAFYYCTSLRSLILPNTIVEIHNRAFIGSGLTRITFPPSLKKLGVGAFEETNLEEITFQGDFPEFLHPAAFNGLTITAYYPADNITWTEDKLQDYGGNVIWIPW